MDRGKIEALEVEAAGCWEKSDWRRLLDIYKDYENEGGIVPWRLKVEVWSRFLCSQHRTKVGAVVLAVISGVAGAFGAWIS